MKTKKLKPGDRKAFILQNIDYQHCWPKGWPGVINFGTALIYFGEEFFTSSRKEGREFNYLVRSKLPKGYKPYENQVVVLELIAFVDPSPRWSCPVLLWKLPENA
jgi:hypothetical protein